MGSGCIAPAAVDNLGETLLGIAAVVGLLAARWHRHLAVGNLLVGQTLLGGAVAALLLLGGRRLLLGELADADADADAAGWHLTSSSALTHSAPPASPPVKMPLYHFEIDRVWLNFLGPNVCLTLDTSPCELFR